MKSYFRFTEASFQYFPKKEMQVQDKQNEHYFLICLIQKVFHQIFQGKKST